MDCIAEQTFRCHPPAGESFVLTAKFGRPETVQPTEPGQHSYGVVLISFEPLAAERRSAGINQFQALCLALEHLRYTLKVFIGEGGRVYYEDTDSLVDPGSSSFASLPGRKDLGGIWWENLPSVNTYPK